MIDNRRRIEFLVHIHFRVITEFNISSARGIFVEIYFIFAIGNKIDILLDFGLFIDIGILFEFKNYPPANKIVMIILATSLIYNYLFPHYPLFYHYMTFDVYTIIYLCKVYSHYPIFFHYKTFGLYTIIYLPFLLHSIIDSRDTQFTSVKVQVRMRVRVQTNPLTGASAATPEPI